MAISTITKQRMDAAVYDALLADIKNGTWKSGEKLPSETDLGQKMGVSRVTVRAAIQRLQAIGLVEVKHGKGTYVVKPEEIYDMSNFERELDLTEKEFNEINALREAIEIQSIRLIMQQERVDLESIGSAYFGMKRPLRSAITRSTPSRITCSIFPLSWPRETTFSSRSLTFLRICITNISRN